MFVVNNLTGFSSLRTTLLPETLALLAAMDVQPSTARAYLINSTIQSFITSSVWGKLELLYVLAAHDEQASRLNWVAPGSFTMTAINSPTFEANRGWTGNGTDAELYTNWNVSSFSTQINTFNGHIGQYNRTDSSVIAGFGTQTANITHMYSSSSGSAGRGRVQSTFSFSPSRVGVMPLHRMVNRPNSSGTNDFYLDGFYDITRAANQNATTNNPITLFRVNTSSYANNQCCAVHLGGTFNNQNANDLYTALYTYMRAVGADT